MKFIIAFLIATVLAMPAHAIIGNIGHSTNLDYAKAIVPESVEKLFINVKAGVAIAAGQVVSLDLTADDGASVVVAPVSGLAPMCVIVAACASGALCKCQTYGIIESALFDVTNSSSVAGKRGWMSTDNAGYISARGTELATEIPLGVFFDAVSASGSVQFFIKL